MIDEVDEPKEAPGWPFPTFWEQYRNGAYSIGTTGELWWQCRDAADGFLRDLGLTELSAKRTAAARILSCLILDAYENDRWDYSPD